MEQVLFDNIFIIHLSNLFFNNLEHLLASRQSGRVTFPDIVDEREGSDHNDDKQLAVVNQLESDDEELQFIQSGNPYKMPPENDVFLIRDKERRRRKKEKAKLSQMSVWEKTKYQQRQAVRRRARVSVNDFGEHLDEMISAEVDAHSGKITVVKDDPQFVLAVTKSRHAEKESLTEYIKKKREMFLLQYALDVKRDEMAKLDKLAREEEEKLALAEQYLEDDAAMFDEFLKENDKMAVEAVRL